MSKLSVFLLVWALLFAGTASAQNVDLSTVPSRDTVQLTIYNSEDLTLVRETRIVTFKKGANPLQFSWANTLIDPSSVELKFLSNADKLDVLDTTFPHDKPAMLYWNVQSEIDGEAKIEITYFTSGISWSADYQLIADKEETKLNFEGFVKIRNNSGEEYENAQVRLVVGTINLVEKIAQLARISYEQASKLREENGKGFSDFKKDAAKEMLAPGGFGGGGGRGAESKPKEIIKEGLSEYFIYTIEGTETIPNGWSKRMRSIEADSVPLKIQYRYRPQQYGEQLVRMYLMANDKASKLGTTPLPDGLVKVYRDNGRDGLSYLTQQPIKYIAIGDKIELNLGPDPEVIFELIKLRSFRDNFWLVRNGTNTYQKLGENVQVREENLSVAGWDDHSIFTQRIRNYTAKPIEVEIRRAYDGHVVFKSLLDPKQHDFRTVEYTSSVPAGKRVDLLHEVITHQGYLSKQSNVTPEKGEVKP